MKSVCRNLSIEKGSVLIQADGHGSEFPKALGNPFIRGNIWKRVFLSEPVQSHCTAGDQSRQYSCLNVSIVSGLDAAFGVANAKLTASLTRRQQQMQQQQ